MKEPSAQNRPENQCFQKLNCQTVNFQKLYLKSYCSKRGHLWDGGEDSHREFFFFFTCLICPLLSKLILPHRIFLYQTFPISLFFTGKQFANKNEQ